jgi:hypothetical protein
MNKGKKKNLKSQKGDGEEENMKAPFGLQNDNSIRKMIAIPGNRRLEWNRYSYSLV